VIYTHRERVCEQEKLKKGERKIKKACAPSGEFINNF
jgi:hypothetical protein